MCEAIGSEPEEDEVPPKFEELLYESQLAIIIYNYFTDCWSGGMSSFYVGKNFANAEYIFTLFNVAKQSRLHIMDFMLIMDRENAKSINEKLSKK